MTNLIHIINPDKFILGGGVLHAEAFLMPNIKETIEHMALTPEAKKTDIMMTELGDDPHCLMRFLYCWLNFSH